METAAAVTLRGGGAGVWAPAQRLALEEPPDIL